MDEYRLAEKQLEDFAKGELKEITPVLEKVLLLNMLVQSVDLKQLCQVVEDIATHGILYHKWNHLKHLLLAKMNVAIDSLKSPSKPYTPQGKSAESLDDRKLQLKKDLLAFESAPFTLQRIAEVVRNPRRHYLNVNKVCNGLDKLLSVSTTISQQVFKAEDDAENTVPLGVPSAAAAGDAT